MSTTRLIPLRALGLLANPAAEVLIVVYNAVAIHYEPANVIAPTYIKLTLKTLCERLNLVLNALVSILNSSCSSINPFNVHSQLRLKMYYSMASPKRQAKIIAEVLEGL